MIENNRNKDKLLSAIITVLLHVGIVAGLFLIILPKIEMEEQGAVLVNIGDIDLSAGTFTPAPLAPATPPPTPSTPQPEPSSQDTEELLSQDSEDAPVITPPKKKTKEKPKTKPKETKTQPAKPVKPIDTEAKKREEEARRTEEQRRQKELEEQQRRDAISKSVSGAFGSAQSKGSGSGESGDRREGSPDGNVIQGGTNQGIGGFGSFNLNGRSLAGSGLPRPSYTSQIEGTIVIKIVVNPSGKVINTSIAPGTNIADTNMRNSALKAAGSAQFNAIDGINNQTGTITYRYRLR
ncbi:energy transducer TonB [Porphyromonas sp.]|uniref:energy transducer TonB family protein n=1 Tax=Porphyromonas sp. TaxID=1924944 RepID=UPI0026DD5A99|nr:energy transducer TonB [Porphyromonas sp.]MDO4770272.1 TonB family protein [Porphyromonas sp.]